MNAKELAIAQWNIENNFSPKYLGYRSTTKWEDLPDANQCFRITCCEALLKVIDEKEKEDTEKLRPTIETQTFYCLSKCIDYFARKYKLELRSLPNKPEDCNTANSILSEYWDWIMEKEELRSGSTFTLDNSDLTDIAAATNTWKSFITELFLQEFGEGPLRKVVLKTSW